MCWCGSKVWMYNREPISGPCGPNAALLPADDRAALCFSFQGRRDRKWASVRPDTGQKVIPDEWKSLRRTQTCRTDKDGTWNSFIFADPWDTGRLTNTHLHYPTITTSSAFQAEPSVCSLGQFNMMNEQMAASQLRSWVLRSQTTQPKLICKPSLPLSALFLHMFSQRNWKRALNKTRL